MSALFKAVGALIAAAVIVVGVTALSSALVPTGPVPVAKFDITPADQKTEAAAKPLPQLLAEADLEKGQKTIKQCVACHTLGEGQASKVGPNLHGIVGRVAGSTAGFAYSENMKAFGAKGGVWSYEDMNTFLTNPKGFIPNTKMAFAGLRKPEDRANVIAYLRSISPKAPALPVVEATAAPAPAAPEPNAVEPAPTPEAQPDVAPAQ